MGWLSRVYRKLFVKYAVYKVDSEGPGIFLGRILCKTIIESSKSTTILKAIENISFTDKNKSVVNYLESLGYSIQDVNNNINHNMIMIRPPELILKNKIKEISLFEYYAIVGSMFKAAGYNVAVRCVKRGDEIEYTAFYLIVIHRKDKYWRDKVDKYSADGRNDVYHAIGIDEKTANIRVAKDLLCFKTYIPY